MTTREFTKPTPEELHAGGAGNYQALMLTTLEFLKQHQISILDYAHFIGKRLSESWAANLTAYQLAQTMAFNFMSVGAKLEELQGDENESRIVITGWPNAEHLAAFSGSVEDVDLFTQLVSKIAEDQNCSFEMKRQGERLGIYFRRKQ